MNPLILLLADGTAFFLGMGMVLISLAAQRSLRRRLARIGFRITGIVGVALVLASSTPFPIWVYCIWLTLWLVAFLFSSGRTRRVIVPFFLLSISLCLLELPHHLSQKIPVCLNQPIYVIGDSISAGVGSSERSWPMVLGDLSHLEVTNLARAGATASSALSQTRRVIKPNALVIIEIGGNDLLHNAPSDQFSKDLALLLENIPASSRCIMFELPLLPSRNEYGRAQRELAKKHNVALIPKKCLTRVIGSTDDTLDGLHLSQKGHDALARSVFSVLAITP